MAVCGCGTSLDGAPNDLIIPGLGIRFDGTFQNPGTTISATAALAWIPYIPAIYGFSIGDGLVRGRYRQDGQTINVQIRVLIKAGTTFSGQFGFDLPPSPYYTVSAPTIITGSGLAVGHGAYGWWSIISPTRYEGNVFVASATIATGGQFKLRMGDDLAGIADTSVVAQGTPITFGANDEIVLSATVEIQ